MPDVHEHEDEGEQRQHVRDRDRWPHSEVSSADSPAPWSARDLPANNDSTRWISDSDERVAASVVVREGMESLEAAHGDHGERAAATGDVARFKSGSRAQLASAARAGIR